jgi:enterochelin esterase family protein
VAGGGRAGRAARRRLGRSGGEPLSLAIREVESAAASDPGAVERFLSTHTFPIIEGTKITFVHHGPADRVSLVHWIFGLPGSQPFTRIEGTDLWYLVLEIPPESRVEYKLELHHGDKRRLIHDPLNPLLAHDPFGANSVCHASGYSVPEWTIHDPDARPGSIEQLVVQSEVRGEPRAVQVYVPARFRDTRKYPLLVVHDGSDYLQYSGLKTVLDNLIHRLEIPSMIVALIDSPRRLREYAADEPHARFVAEELLPALEERYPLDGDSAARGLMGASFGGVAALFTAWRYPGVFGRLLLQSGSFGFTDIGQHRRGPAFDPVVEWVNTLRESPGRPSERVFMSCGVYESLIYENRSLVPLLQGTGMELRYVEARDGHNWENWRDRLREGLSWLFPGPLWMVYE